MAPRIRRAPRLAAVWLTCALGIGCDIPVSVDGDRSDGGNARNAGPAGWVRISPGGATFVGRQMVTLSAPGGGDIHYTLDGSVPTMDSPVYQGPVAVETPTVVRALASRGPAAGTISSASFLPVGEELRSWSSNLPVVLLHTHDSGALAVVENAPRVPGSASLLVPGPGGRTTLVGGAALSTRAGLRLRGASSVTFPQKSYALELRDPGSDSDVEHAVLGLPADSDFALVGAAFMDRSLMRNALAYAVSNSIGRWAPKTRFVELFVVEHGGPARASDYQGVYTLAETIKRAPRRVDIARLDPSVSSGPGLTGGYIVRIDKGAPNFVLATNTFQYVYPDWEEISDRTRASQRSYIEGFLGEFLESAAAPDFRHPRTRQHYRDYIDVPAFIDHNLIIALFKNVDGLRLSAYFHKTQNDPDAGPGAGKLLAGPVWDFDRSAGTPFDDPHYGMPRALEPREWARQDSTHPLMWGFWGRLFADPTFKAAHAARWDELSRGPMSVMALHRLIDAMTAEIQEAQARHFARWPNMPATDGRHEVEIRNLKTWFGARVPWLSEQL